MILMGEPHLARLWGHWLQRTLSVISFINHFIFSPENFNSFLRTALGVSPLLECVSSANIPYMGTHVAVDGQNNDHRINKKMDVGFSVTKTAFYTDS